MPHCPPLAWRGDNFSGWRDEEMRPIGLAREVRSAAEADASERHDERVAVQHMVVSRFAGLGVCVCRQSRTLDVVGVVDGSTFVHRSLVGGVD